MDFQLYNLPETIKCMYNTSAEFSFLVSVMVGSLRIGNSSHASLYLDHICAQIGAQIKMEDIRKSIPNEWHQLWIGAN